MSLIKQTNTIPDAATVRHLLKAKGFTEKLSVRRSSSPFSGTTFFSVEITAPARVSVITSCASDRPGTAYGSNDGGQHAGRLAELDRTLEQIESEHPESHDQN